VHADQEAAGAENTIIAFIEIVTGKFVNDVINQPPSAKIEISHAKIGTLYSGILENTLKALSKFQTNIVVDSRH